MRTPPTTVSGLFQQPARGIASFDRQHRAEKGNHIAEVGAVRADRVGRAVRGRPQAVNEQITRIGECHQDSLPAAPEETGNGAASEAI